MRRESRWFCDGRHYDGDLDDDADWRGVPAEYFRGCAWCGIEIDLCLGCRDRKFTCDRCFGEKGQYGVDQARQMAAARERDRERKRRERRRVLRVPRMQRTFWNGKDLLGERA